MKKSRRSICFLLSLSVCLLLLLGGCGGQNTAAADGQTLSGLGIARIEFGIGTGSAAVSGHTIQCSDAVLKNANAPEKATVYYEPEETITQPAFPSDIYEVSTYEHGTFTLNRKNQASHAVTTLTNEEATKIAEDFLREYGLYCDDLQSNKKVDNDTLVRDNETFITGKTVNFYPKTEGNAPLFGNSHVSVKLAADGQVNQVIYNHIHYTKEVSLPLMTPQQALKRAKASTDPTEVLLETEGNPGKELTIANVRLAYYENVTRNAPTRQPVYVFESDESDTPFVICVPAAQP